MPLDPRIPLMGNIYQPDFGEIAQNRAQSMNVLSQMRQRDQELAQQNAFAEYMKGDGLKNNPLGALQFGEAGQRALSALTNYQQAKTAQDKDAREAAAAKQAQQEKVFGTSLMRAYADPSDANLDERFADMEVAGIDTSPFRQMIGQVPDPAARKKYLDDFLNTTEEGRVFMDRFASKPREIKLNNRVLYVEGNENRDDYNQEISQYDMGMSPDQVSRERIAGKDRASREEIARMQQESANQRAAQAKGTAKDEAREIARAGSITSATMARDAIDRALKTLGGEEKRAIGESGGIGTIASFLPGTKAFNLKNNYYNSIRSVLTTEALKNLRLSSPTGAGVGNVSNQENTLLGQGIAVLDVSLDEKEQELNLRKTDSALNNLILLNEGKPHIPRVTNDAEAAKLKSGDLFYDGDFYLRRMP